MAELDMRALAGELARRYGIRTDDGDPALAIVALNSLVLENAIDELATALARRLNEFETSLHRVEHRAGKTIAQQILEISAQIGIDIKKGADAAVMNASHVIYQANQRHKRPNITRWLPVVLFSAVALFGCGVWFGNHCFVPW